MCVIECQCSKWPQHTLCLDTKMAFYNNKKNIYIDDDFIKIGFAFWQLQRTANNLFARNVPGPIAIYSWLLGIYDDLALQPDRPSRPKIVFVFFVSNKYCYFFSCCLHTCNATQKNLHLNSAQIRTRSLLQVDKVSNNVCLVALTNLILGVIHSHSLPLMAT